MAQWLPHGVAADVRALVSSMLRLRSSHAVRQCGGGPPDRSCLLRPERSRRMTLSPDACRTFANQPWCRMVDPLGYMRAHLRQPGDASHERSERPRHARGHNLPHRARSSSTPTSAATTWRRSGRSTNRTRTMRTTSCATSARPSPSSGNTRTDIEPLLQRSAADQHQILRAPFADPGQSGPCAQARLGLDHVYGLPAERSQRDHAAAPALAERDPPRPHRRARTSPASKARTSPSARATWS